jgi:hypothetical protein
MKMNPTLIALAETVLYTECDDRDEPLDKNYSITDFEEESLKKLYTDYQSFISIVEGKITAAIGDKWDCIDDFYDLAQPAPNQTEYDYILTRNRCGDGFDKNSWNPRVALILKEAAQSQPEVEAYLGDDGKIYFA